MKLITTMIKSRTFWTIVFMFVVGGLNQTTQFLSPEAATTLTGLLGILATYFHLNPSQQYGQ